MWYLNLLPFSDTTALIAYYHSSSPLNVQCSDHHVIFRVVGTWGNCLLVWNSWSILGSSPSSSRVSEIISRNRGRAPWIGHGKYTLYTFKMGIIKINKTWLWAIEQEYKILILQYLRDSHFLWNFLNFSMGLVLSFTMDQIWRKLLKKDSQLAI